MTSQEKRGGIKKIRPVREEEETRYVISPGASDSAPFIFRSAKDAGEEPSCQKEGRLLDGGSCPVLSWDQSGEAGPSVGRV